MDQVRERSGLALSFFFIDGDWIVQDVFVGSPQDLRSLCEKVIARFDMGVLQPIASVRQAAAGRARATSGDPSCHTPGMKAAVSIPDQVFAEAERLARRLKKSRSELYSHALREYVARHCPEYVTENLDRICGDSPAE